MRDPLKLMRQAHNCISLRGSFLKAVWPCRSWNDSCACGRLRRRSRMIPVLAHNWWAVVLRGLGAILFGLFTLAAPGRTLAVLVLLFGVYALADGIATIASALRGR